MAGVSPGSIFVSHVEKCGPFLKIWGIFDRITSTNIDKTLYQLASQLDQTPALTPASVQVGLLCSANVKGRYYRAQISNTHNNISNLLKQNLIEVLFVDHGNREIVSIVTLKSINDIANSILTAPPLAQEFILANVTHTGSTWKDETINMIYEDLYSSDLRYLIVHQIQRISLVKLFKANNEEALINFFNNGLILSIATSAQHMIIAPNVLSSKRALPATKPSLKEELSPLQTLQKQPTFLTYKPLTVDCNRDYNVYVSYVSDGPIQFYIQLQEYEEALALLMRELNNMNLQQLDEDPIPGTVCVARCLEDQHICRAVVTSIIDGKYKVFYVDFGNTEVVSIDQLFQIPFKYVLTKVMAMRYTLADLESCNITVEMKCAFKEFVCDNLLIMRSVQRVQRSSTQYCTLRDQNNVNVMDILRKAALLAYPEVMTLSRGFSQEVRVSYVHSCSSFYVQIKSKDDQLRNLMAELQVKSSQLTPINNLSLKLGLPCCALFETDNQWYRGQVVDIKGDQIYVRYVDYGNTEIVSLNNLKTPSPHQLTILKPQAIECCLNGYQNMPADTERDTTLEELALEKEFTMKVVEVLSGGKVLVELIDSLRYNIGSLLLERLANARSQVSPILIQDSHNIEIRKREEPESTFNKFQRRNTGDKNKGDRFQKQEQKHESWRQKPSPREENFNEESSKLNDNFRSNSSANSNFSTENQKRRDYHSSERFKSETFARSPPTRENFNNNRFSSDKNKDKNWSSPSSDKFNREDGDKKWKGSEKNWRSSDNYGKKSFEKTDFGKRERSSSWKKEEFCKPKEENMLDDPAPFNSPFKLLNVKGQSAKVLISWLHDPSHFFCQLEEHQNGFRNMMNEIQQVYCKIKPVEAPNGASVVALYPEDNILYRAKILNDQNFQYRVQYIDFGNVSTTSKVWPIDKKFMDLPAQAICCGLEGVIPSQDNWLDTDHYAPYFDTEFFICNFLSVEGNKYSVDLISEERHLSEVLAESNLVKYQWIPEDTPLVLSLLVGQQLHVTLLEAEDLNNIKVSIGANRELLCSAHNLSQAVDSFPDVLKALIGSNLIIYVDNVLDNILEVTFYDNIGSKVKIIEPDEGAFNEIDALCQFPICNSTINGWVCFLVTVDERQRVYIQFDEYSEILANLLEQLYNHYNGTEPENDLVPQIEAYYAVKSSDDNWYRGQITNIDSESATVLFVDYGNSEILQFDKLRLLDQKFKEQHILALEISTSGLTESIIEQKVTAKIWCGESGWEGNISIYTTEQILLETNLPIQEDYKSPEIIQQDEETPSSQVISQEIVSNVTEMLNQDEGVQVDEVNSQKIKVSVEVSHIDNPNQFYVQSLNAIEKIEALLDTIQKEVVNWSDLENPTVGMLCAAPFSVDEQWYRAQILDADNDITTVRFVDFGNTDVIDNNSTKIKTLPSELLTLEQYANRCSLLVKPIENEWLPAACERFEAIIKSSKTVYYEIIDQDEKAIYVQLYGDTINIGETLINENLGIEFHFGSDNTGYISHLNSPSEFWIQFENSVPDLESIADRLTLASSFPELEDLTPGSLCAALFSEDDMWYRARILSNTVAGLEVLFIDYGNSCTCSSGLKQLPEDLVMLPALAQKCSLEKPPGVLQWSNQAVNEFKARSADGATIFTIEKLSAGETALVRLLLNNENIVDKLIPVTFNVLVTHFETVFSFWLQKENDAAKIAELHEKLQNLDSCPKFESGEMSDKVVAAWFPDDKSWYRAKILNVNQDQYEVLFIDYGNKSHTNEMKILPDELAQIPNFASQYKLESLPGFMLTEAASEKLAEISNNGNTVFQAEFINDEVVQLYVNGADVRFQLDSVSISSVHSTPVKNPILSTDEKYKELENEVIEFELKNDTIQQEIDSEIIQEKIENEIIQEKLENEIIQQELKSETTETEVITADDCTTEIIKQDIINDDLTEDSNCLENKDVDVVSVEEKIAYVSNCEEQTIMPDKHLKYKINNDQSKMVEITNDYLESIQAFSSNLLDDILTKSTSFTNVQLMHNDNEINQNNCNKNELTEQLFEITESDDQLILSEKDLVNDNIDSIVGNNKICYDNRQKSCSEEIQSYSKDVLDILEKTCKSFFDSSEQCNLTYKISDDNSDHNLLKTTLLDYNKQESPESDTTNQNIEPKSTLNEQIEDLNFDQNLENSTNNQERTESDTTNIEPENKSNEKIEDLNFYQNSQDSPNNQERTESDAINQNIEPESTLNEKIEELNFDQNSENSKNIQIRLESDTTYYQNIELEYTLNEKIGDLNIDQNSQDSTNNQERTESDTINQNIEPESTLNEKIEELNFDQNSENSINIQVLVESDATYHNIELEYTLNEKIEDLNFDQNLKSSKNNQERAESDTTNIEPENKSNKKIEDLNIEQNSQDSTNNQERIESDTINENIEPPESTLNEKIEELNFDQNSENSINIQVRLESDTTYQNIELEYTLDEKIEDLNFDQNLESSKNKQERPESETTNQNIEPKSTLNEKIEDLKLDQNFENSTNNQERAESDTTNIEPENKSNNKIEYLNIEQNSQDSTNNQERTELDTINQNIGPPESTLNEKIEELNFDQNSENSKNIQVRLELDTTYQNIELEYTLNEKIEDLNFDQNLENLTNNQERAESDNKNIEPENKLNEKIEDLYIDQNSQDSTNYQEQTESDITNQNIEPENKLNEKIEDLNFDKNFENSKDNQKRSESDTNRNVELDTTNQSIELENKSNENIEELNVDQNLGNSSNIHESLESDTSYQNIEPENTLNEKVDDLDSDQNSQDLTNNQEHVEPDATNQDSEPENLENLTNNQECAESNTVIDQNSYKDECPNEMNAFYKNNTNLGQTVKEKYIEFQPILSKNNDDTNEEKKFEEINDDTVNCNCNLILDITENTASQNIIEEKHLDDYLIKLATKFEDSNAITDVNEPEKKFAEIPSLSASYIKSCIETAMSRIKKQNATLLCNIDDRSLILDIPLFNSVEKVESLLSDSTLSIITSLTEEIISDSINEATKLCEHIKDSHEVENENLCKSFHIDNNLTKMHRIEELKSNDHEENISYLLDEEVVPEFENSEMQCLVTKNVIEKELVSNEILNSASTILETVACNLSEEIKDSSSPNQSDCLETSETGKLFIGENDDASLEVSSSESNEEHSEDKLID